MRETNINKGYIEDYYEYLDCNEGEDEEWSDFEEIDKALSITAEDIRAMVEDIQAKYIRSHFKVIRNK